MLLARTSAAVRRQICTQQLPTIWRLLASPSKLTGFRKPSNFADKDHKRKVTIKYDILCHEFHMLAPHTCVVNESDATYLIKCTENTEEKADRNSKQIVELTMDGFYEAEKGEMVNFYHSITALLGGVKVIIYRENGELAERFWEQEIQPNKRLTINPK